MLDAIGSELIQVLRDLAVAGIAFLAFGLSWRSTIENGPAVTLLKGWAWCAGIGLLCAVLLGQGTCVSGDPLFGYCEETTGSYEPSTAHRAATLAYWFALLAVPVAFGALNRTARIRAFLRRTRPDAS